MNQSSGQRKQQHVVWDSPGGVFIPMPDCADCGHSELVHLLNAKRERRQCTVGPFNALVVQCPCKRYRYEP